MVLGITMVLSSSGGGMWSLVLPYSSALQGMAGDPWSHQAAPGTAGHPGSSSDGLPSPGLSCIEDPSTKPRIL